MGAVTDEEAAGLRYVVFRTPPWFVSSGTSIVKAETTYYLGTESLTVSKDEN